MKIFLTLLFACSLYAIQDASLLHFTWKKYSQSGEEGVLDCMLERMGIETGFFVEFGAADGVFFSNTRFLAEKGWKGAWIESSPTYFKKLLQNSAAFPGVLCIQEFIATTPSSPHTLDAVAGSYFPSEEIDVLSIDIDGLDYLVLEGLKSTPKIICIESPAYWHPSLKTRVPDEVAAKNLGQPLAIMIEIAKKQGYEPVCFLLDNLLFVRKDFYPLFSEIQNDAETLWLDSWAHIEEKQPEDLRYLCEVRRTNPWIQKYDPTALCE